MAGAAFLVFLLAQDEGAERVKGLLERLQDDAIDARAKAADELVRIGPSALHQIGEAERAASAELKGRLAEVRRRISDRMHFLSLLPPASFVTLEAKDRPVREVLEDLRRQGRTSIDDARVPPEERVTLSLKSTTFWEAVDAVCRAHGALQYTVEGEKVTVRKGTYVARPLLFSGPFAVFLTTWARQGDRWSQFQLQLCWEKGTRPGGIHYDLHELKKTERIDLEGVPRDGSDVYHPQVGSEAISQRLVLDLGKVPLDDPARVERVTAEIRCRFILSTTGVTFEDPMVGTGTKAARGRVVVGLGGCKRSGDRFWINFSLEAQDIGREELELLEIGGTDPSGKTHRIGTVAPLSPRMFPQMSVGMATPREVTGLKSLSFTVPDQVHVERLTIPFSAMIEALKR